MIKKYNIRFLVIASFIAAAASLLFGYDSGVIGAANLFIPYSIPSYSYSQQQVSISQFQLVTSILAVGFAVGAIIGGPFTDCAGRKAVIIIADLLFIIAALILSLANSVAGLVTGRIVTGIGFGLAVVVTPIYLSQISPKAVRGRIIAILIICIALGSILSYVFGYWFGSQWKLLFALAAIPAAIQGLGMTMMPQSPRWLYKQQNYAKALQQISKIYNTDEHEGRKEMRSEIDQLKQSIAEEGNMPWKEQMRSLFKHHYRAVGVGNLVYMIRSFTGASAIFNYGPTIIQSAGFAQEYQGVARQQQILLYTLPVFAIKFLFSLIMFFLIDSKGRKFVMLISLPLIGICLWLLGLSFYLLNAWSLSWARWLSLISFGLFFGFLALGMGNAPNILNSEIYPLPLRGTANSFAAAIEAITGYIVMAVFLTSTSTVIGSLITYSVLGLVCMIGILLVVLYVPQTKGKSLPEVVKMFRSDDRITEPEEKPLFSRNQQSIN